MNLILYGFKSAGKTYFGKKLSEKKGLPFIDTDHIIEKLYLEKYHTPLSCRQIHQEKGNEFFRALEKEAIKSLAKTKSSIIALGGGTVLDQENARFLANIGTLVYLQIDRDVIKKRQLSGALPSYLDPKDPEGSFSKMYEERKTAYESLPSVWIDVNVDEESVMTELIALLEGSHGK